MNPLRAAIASIIIALRVAAPAGARADEHIRFGNPQPVVLLGVGPVWAMYELGEVDPAGGGVHLEVLARVFPETLAGVEADAVLIGNGPPTLDRQTSGRAVRAGAKLRHSLLGWGPERFGGELALVGGIGHEQIDWNRGGRLRRTQFMIGAEDCLVTRPSGRYAGIAFNFRAIFSREVGAGWSSGLMFDFIVRGSP